MSRHGEAKQKKGQRMAPSQQEKTGFLPNIKEKPGSQTSSAFREYDQRRNYVSSQINSRELEKTHNPLSTRGHTTTSTCSSEKGSYHPRSIQVPPSALREYAQRRNYNPVCSQECRVKFFRITWQRPVAVLRRTVFAVLASRVIVPLPAVVLKRGVFALTVSSRLSADPLQTKDKDTYTERI